MLIKKTCIRRSQSALFKVCDLCKTCVASLHSITNSKELKIAMVYSQEDIQYEYIRKAVGDRMILEMHDSDLGTLWCLWCFGERRGAQTIRVPSYRGKCSGQLVIQVYSGWKKLTLQFILLYLRYMWEEGVDWKRHIGGRGWLNTSEYCHMGGRGLKLLNKTSYGIWTYPFAQI